MAEPMRRGIGQNVKSVRVDRELSQEALANKVKTSAKHLSRLELGTANITIDILNAIAEKLSVELADLVWRRGKGDQLYVLTQREVDQIFRILDRAKNRRYRRWPKPQ
jgi:transcriptional regulator with XRE-family HTH domain